MKRTLLSWSSGKDSAWALHVLRQTNDLELCGLFTVINQAYQRVSMHAVRLELLQLQATAVGLPLQVIEIPYPCSNEQYDSIMHTFIRESRAGRIECMAFGDLFLQDVRTYRESRLQGTGIAPVFPLWNIPTSELAEGMLSAGVDAYISCVDPKQVPAHLSGRQWSKKLISELPGNADPCGENGEFHTVVVGGPMFHFPIPITIGESIEREGFVFTDVIPQVYGRDQKNVTCG